MSIRFDVSAPYEVDESDVVFARPDGRDRVARLYRPRGEIRDSLGAVVDVHGGAWNRGDHLTDALHCRALAASGLVVLSLDFRQGPEHQHPRASADVAAGVRHARAHARALGIDPRRIGLLGSSSGGQLVLLAAVTPGSAEHVGSPALLPGGGVDGGTGDASVAFVVALYPVADPLARYRYVQGRENDGTGFDAKRLIASHRAFFASEEDMERASVTRILGAGEATALPPAWVAHPGTDDNVPAEITDAFVSAYEKAGGRIERVRFPAAKHGFIGQASADTEQCIALVREFIGRQLGGGAPARS
jgi:acetyl esterase/lipase